MEQLSAVLATVLLIAKVLVVLAIPIVLAQSGLGLLNRLARKEYFEIPALGNLSALFGVFFGLALIYANYDVRYYDFSELFLPESAWNISLWRFLAERANPFNYGVVPVFGRLFSDKAGPVFMLLAFFSALLLGLIGFVSHRVWRSDRPQVYRSLLCSLGIGAWVTYLTIYIVSLVFWLLYLLNFWTFLVLAGTFQLYRSQRRKK
ncbi:MAG: hypothetical protein HY057_03510 [Rhodospirillales bacterium]|nr:hypothetical protein [Rhodospirillales bacterium]